MKQKTPFIVPSFERLFCLDLIMTLIKIEFSYFSFQTVFFARLLMTVLWV